MICGLFLVSVSCKLYVFARVQQMALMVILFKYLLGHTIMVFIFPPPPPPCHTCSICLYSEFVKCEITSSNRNRLQSSTGWWLKSGFGDRQFWYWIWDAVCLTTVASIFCSINLRCCWKSVEITYGKSLDKFTVKVP